MPPPPRVRLTGRAQRFLHLLQDFGHLDEQRFDELMVSLTELGHPPHEVLVDLPAVKRAAAIVLFGHGDPNALRDIESGALAEDWPFLFS